VLGRFSAATITGHEAGATEFLHWLKPHAENPDIASTFEDVHRTIRPSSSFEILLARYANDTPELVHYRSVPPAFSHAPVIATGSPPEDLKSEMRGFLRRMAARGWPSSASAVGLTSLMMWGGVHNAPAFAHGIGGAYYSLTVGPQGVSWTPDTRVIVVPPALSQPVRTYADPYSPAIEPDPVPGLHAVTIIERDGILVVGSSIADGTILTNDFVARDLVQWRAIWETRISSELAKTPRYVVLLSMYPSRILILDMEAEGSGRLYIEHEGKMMLHSELRSMLFAPLEEGIRDVVLYPLSLWNSTEALLGKNELSGADARDLAHRALVHGYDGDIEQAAACLMRALATAPEDEMVLSCAAQFVVQNKDASAVAELLTELLVRNKNALSFVNRLATDISGIDPAASKALLAFLGRVGRPA
jgi:hypothetical protein